MRRAAACSSAIGRTSPPSPGRGRCPRRRPGIAHGAATATRTAAGTTPRAKRRWLPSIAPSTTATRPVTTTHRPITATAPTPTRPSCGHPGGTCPRAPGGGEQSRPTPVGHRAAPTRNGSTVHARTAATIQVVRRMPSAPGGAGRVVIPLTVPLSGTGRATGGARSGHERRGGAPWGATRAPGRPPGPCAAATARGSGAASCGTVHCDTAGNGTAYRATPDAVGGAVAEADRALRSRLPQAYRPAAYRATPTVQPPTARLPRDAHRTPTAQRPPHSRLPHDHRAAAYRGPACCGIPCRRAAGGAVAGVRSRSSSRRVAP